MKNSGNNRNILKIIFFPIYIFIAIYKAIAERLEFSIRLKLSLRYVRILINTMLAAGVGVILVFGGLKVYATISEDHAVILSALNKASSSYSEIQQYADEQHVPVLIYDQSKRLIHETETGFAEFGYKEWLGYVWTDQNFYLGINRNMVISDIPVHIIIYSEISKELAEILYISKIILMVFLSILFFSIISIALSGRGIFQPIGEMTQTVKSISEKNLNLRINVSGSKNELKELAQTFNEMMNRIEDNYNRQRQFVSDASHELRTPIAVIQGYAVMLDRWGKNDQEVLQESITAIKNESENMQELIDKLLFLARHDNSTFVFQKEEFSLTEMLLEIVKETQIIDTAHTIQGDIHTEVSLFADKNRLKQAIRVFIENAIKYTPANGEITVSLGQEEDLTAIRIKDTGIGMTHEELKYIFDRFYRADQSRTKEKGGHGLGLAIAKIIILGHNGKIKVRSKLGEGSEFIILLPGGSQLNSSNKGGVKVADI